MPQDFMKAEEASQLNVAALTPVSTEANPAGFSHPMSIIRLINDSNQTLCVEYGQDGVTNDILLPHSSLTLYSQSSSQPQNQKSLFAKGTIVSFCNPNGPAGAGFVYVTGYYQQ